MLARKLRLILSAEFFPLCGLLLGASCCFPTVFGVKVQLSAAAAAAAADGPTPTIPAAPPASFDMVVKATPSKFLYQEGGTHRIHLLFPLSNAAKIQGEHAIFNTDNTCQSAKEAQVFVFGEEHSDEVHGSRPNVLNGKNVVVRARKEMSAFETFLQRVVDRVPVASVVPNPGFDQLWGADAHDVLRNIRKRSAMLRTYEPLVTTFVDDPVIQSGMIGAHPNFPRQLMEVVNGDAARATGVSSDGADGVINLRTFIIDPVDPDNYHRWGGVPSQHIAGKRHGSRHTVNLDRLPMTVENVQVAAGPQRFRMSVGNDHSWRNALLNELRQQVQQADPVSGAEVRRNRYEWKQAELAQEQRESAAAATPGGSSNSTGAPLATWIAANAAEIAAAASSTPGGGDSDAQLPVHAGDWTSPAFLGSKSIADVNAIYRAAAQKVYAALQEKHGLDWPGLHPLPILGLKVAHWDDPEICYNLSGYNTAMFGDDDDAPFAGIMANFPGSQTTLRDAIAHVFFSCLAAAAGPDKTASDVQALLKGPTAELPNPFLLEGPDASVEKFADMFSVFVALISTYLDAQGIFSRGNGGAQVGLFLVKSMKTWAKYPRSLFSAVQPSGLTRGHRFHRSGGAQPALHDDASNCVTWGPTSPSRADLGNQYHRWDCTKVPHKNPLRMFTDAKKPDDSGRTLLWHQILNVLQAIVLNLADWGHVYFTQDELHTPEKQAELGISADWGAVSTWNESRKKLTAYRKLFDITTTVSDHVDEAERVRKIVWEPKPILEKLATDLENIWQNFWVVEKDQAHLDEFAVLFRNAAMPRMGISPTIDRRAYSDVAVDYSSALQIPFLEYWNKYYNSDRVRLSARLAPYLSAVNHARNSWSLLATAHDEAVERESGVSHAWKERNKIQQDPDAHPGADPTTGFRGKETFRLKHSFVKDIRRSKYSVATENVALQNTLATVENLSIFDFWSTIVRTAASAPHSEASEETARLLLTSAFSLPSSRAAPGAANQEHGAVPAKVHYLQLFHKYIARNNVLGRFAEWHYTVVQQHVARLEYRTETMTLDNERLFHLLRHNYLLQKALSPPAKLRALLHAEQNGTGNQRWSGMREALTPNASTARAAISELLHRNPPEWWTPAGAESPRLRVESDAAHGRLLINVTPEEKRYLERIVQHRTKHFFLSKTDAAKLYVNANFFAHDAHNLIQHTLQLSHNVDALDFSTEAARTEFQGKFDRLIDHPAFDLLPQDKASRRESFGAWLNARASQSDALCSPKVLAALLIGISAPDGSIGRDFFLPPKISTPGHAARADTIPGNVAASTERSGLHLLAEHPFLMFPSLEEHDVIGMNDTVGQRVLSQIGYFLEDISEEQYRVLKGLLVQNIEF
ncbi:unnamed protein product [Amoebophrya sp. A120]|nr:unnamed protein product [Amoebophrya sp. A120]|eukprot:GSA120T00009506001.1